MTVSPNEAVSWLQQRARQRIKIEKLEQAGRDEVRLELDDVELRNSERYDPEHYAANEAILLRGSGRMMNDDAGGASPLPLDTFEIPLVGAWSAQRSDDRLHIVTERAEYTITSEPSE